MKISVVIPVYNGEKYVAQCIENMLCQSFEELEIVVVDDGSTDRTAEIAASYSAVKLIRKATNQGLSAARNSGIEAATGDYIHFMDVDDIIGLDYYALMAEALTFTDADMAYGAVINEAKTHGSFHFSDRMLVSTFEDKIAVTGAVINHSACRYLIRKALLNDKNLRFRPENVIEDMAFTLEAVEAARTIVTVPGATYCYRKREGSIMNSRNREVARRREKAYKQACAFRRDFLRERGLSSHVAASRHVVYKILGFIKIHRYSYTDGADKWFLGKLRLMKRQKVRL